MVKKEIIFLLGFIFLMSIISFVSAEIGYLGSFKSGDCVELKQACYNTTSGACSFNTISEVWVSPTSVIVLEDADMSSIDNIKYNYTLCNTTLMGTYNVQGYGDGDDSEPTWSYTFDVTPSGFTNTLGFYILILIISGAIILFGFWERIDDPYVVLLGTIGLYFVGLFVILNGIVEIRDTTTTWAIGLVLLGLAGYISIKTAISLFD